MLNIAVQLRIISRIIYKTRFPIILCCPENFRHNLIISLETKYGKTLKSLYSYKKKYELIMIKLGFFAEVVEREGL